MKKLMLSVFALAAFGFSANAQISDPATATGSAVLLETISVANNQGLNFGQITLSAGHGVITMTTNVSGTPTTITTGSAAGYTLLSTVPKTPASFTVTGLGGASYNINKPNSELTLTGGSGTVKITSFSTPSATRTIGSGGTDIFYIAGVLDIAEGTGAEGTYTGDFEVTVNYN